MLSAYLAGGDPVAMPVETLGGIVERIVSGRPQRRAFLGVSTQPGRAAGLAKDTPAASNNPPA